MMMIQRLLVLVGMIALLAASPVFAAAPTDVRLTRDHGSTKAVLAETIIDAPVEIVWNELTDYGKIKNVLPGYDRSTVLAANGNTSTVDLSLRAIPPFTPSFRYQVRIQEDRAAHIVNVQRISGDFRSLSASYRLIPIDNGTRTRVVYQMQIDLGSMPSLGAGRIVKNNAGRQLSAFQGHCARAYQRALTARATR